MALAWLLAASVAQAQDIEPRKWSNTPVAIMVQLDSPLRRKIDIALLALREDGSYQRLYEKWFGSP